MKLDQYIKSLSSSELQSFADRCETSVGYLKQVYLGNRTASGDLAINIERESNQAVLCEDLRPDTDWKYIRSTEPVRAA